MADNDNVIIDENGESVTIKDDSGKPAVFHFFEETYIPLDDEDGVTTEFECIASMEYEGVIYYALLPKPENEDDEPEEFVVLKGEEDGDELLFSSIDSEEENQRIGAFPERSVLNGRNGRRRRRYLTVIIQRIL